MKEYAIYPFQTMNITQNYNQGNHIPHWQGSKNHSDKPWDEACKDGGREYFIPQNDFVVEEVLGVDTSSTKGYTNSVRLRSVNKLYTPFKNEADILYLTLTHMNEDNLRQVKVGQVLKKGTKLLLEGTDGYATGNHFHITANFGKYYGFLKNSNGSWCFTYEKSLLPHEAFYVEPTFTTIKNANGSKFQNVPIDKYGTPVPRNESVNQIEILADNVRARTMPSTNSGKILGYMNKGIYNVTQNDVGDGYTWYKVDDVWFAYSNEWAKFYNKIEEVVESSKEQQEQSKVEDNTNTLIDDETSEKSLIMRLIEKIVNLLCKLFGKK